MRSRLINYCGKQTSKATMRHFLPRLRHGTSATAALPILPPGRVCLCVVLPIVPCPNSGFLCHSLPHSCDCGTIAVWFLTFATCGNLRDCGSRARTFAIPYRWGFFSFDDTLSFISRSAFFALVFPSFVSFICPSLCSFATFFLTSRS